MDLSGLSAGTLDRRLRQLLGEERRIQVDFLLHLDEFDRQRGFSAFGATSTWYYLRHELGMLECAIQRRLAAMEVIRRAPAAVEYLRDGRLCVTGAALLKDVLTAGNSDRVLESASNKSRREIEYIVTCEREPRPEPAPMLRRLPDSPSRSVATSEDVPVPRTAGVDAGGASPLRETAADGDRDQECRRPTEILEKSRADFGRVEPLSAERFLLKVPVGREFVELLEKAKVALSHVEPRGDLEGVLRRALEAVVAAAEKKHATKTPRAPAKAKGGEVKGGEAKGGGAKGGEAEAKKKKRSRTIPAAVKAEVWKRDGGTCVWPMPSGGVCGSEWRLDYDHVVPWAKGGESTVENVRLLCRGHNGEHARRCFGDDFVEKKIAEARQVESRATTPGDVQIGGNRGVADLSGRVALFGDRRRGASSADEPDRDEDRGSEQEPRHDH